MSDLDIIKQIEKQIGSQLMMIYEIGFDKTGYTLNESGNVTGLSLPHYNLGDLNRIAFPMNKLKSLHKLDLRRNNLTDISSLQRLENLTDLDLSHNYLRDISSLQRLENLTDLDLSHNYLRDISPLQRLENLTDLKLGYNNLTDISPLQGLTNLSTLHLYYNDITDIVLLKNLANLIDLHLGYNKLADISPLQGLENLTDLKLGRNNLTDISPLRGLTNLNKLYLYDNKISDISPLRGLTNLKALDMAGNPIKKLPFWITEFDMDIQLSNNGDSGYISFYDSLLINPPVEIVKQGKKAVKNYFAQLEEQGTDYIYEAKMMIVGEPGVGKTTLFNLLFDRNHPVPDKKQKSTLGIEVRQDWKFSIDKDTGFKAHIWDFGGQQIQYMLHQFFLTSDCLYVLMAEKRKELTNFDYWLNIINILGKDSPVIALLNEIDIESATSCIYDEKKYKGLFPELDIQKLDINFTVKTDGSFETLVSKIKEKLCGLEHIGNEVPARWLEIRTELENKRSKKHIAIKEYLEICTESGLDNEEDCMLVLKTFHLLGIVLHFGDDPNLNDILFLDPNWTVDAVYAALNSKVIQDNNGVFELKQIEKIWKDKRYDIAEISKLLQLMLKDNFELCYKIPGEKDKYLVPLLLSKSTPDYDWDHKDNLQFRFQYPFMPKGIVSRLIVRLNEYIDGDKMWREGVVLRKKNASAQVIERKTPKEGLKIIDIHIQGTPENRKVLLTLIREEIERIQNNSFPNLPYSEMVPCSCAKCTDSGDKDFYDYSVLERYVNKNKQTIECRNSTEDVEVHGLIDAVGMKGRETQKLQDRRTGDGMIEKNVKVDVNVSPTFIQTMTNEQKQENKQDQTVSQEQTQTVTVTVKQVQQVQGLFKNLQEDILDEIDDLVEDEDEKKRIEKDLNKVGKAFNEVEKAAAEEKKEIDEGTKNRLENFFDNIKDENSRIGKALKLTSDGVKTAQKLGGIYNKFAPYFALPSVPPIFLGKDD